jgi:hypothetical protein
MALRSFETWQAYPKAQCHIPEDHNPQQNRWEENEVSYLYSSTGEED